MSNGREEPFEELLDEHLQRRSPSLEGLDTAQQKEAESLFEVADLLWERAHGAPPLELDPVAAMLGLIPDSARSLDPRALRSVTRRAGLKPSGLAEKLSARGWDVETRDVFSWQTRSAADVPPALIQAIAEVTDSTVEELIVDRGSSPLTSAVEAVTQTPEFKALARRWARMQNTSVDLATSALSARLGTSVHRGTHPDKEEMLRSLEALVSALEAEKPDEDQH